MYTFFHKTEETPGHLHLDQLPPFFRACLVRPIMGFIKRQNAEKDNLNDIFTKLQRRYTGKKAVLLNQCTANELRAEITFLSTCFYTDVEKVKLRNAFSVVIAQHNGILNNPEAIFKHLLTRNNDPRAISVAKFTAGNVLLTLNEAIKYLFPNNTNPTAMRNPSIQQEFAPKFANAKTVREYYQLHTQLTQLLQQYLLRFGGIEKMSQFGAYLEASEDDDIETWIDDYPDDEYEFYCHSFMELGLGFIPPKRTVVKDRLEQFLTTLADKLNTLDSSHPDMVIATACYALRSIIDDHYFTDGNGRISRCLVNLILVQNGLPPITWADAKTFNNTLNQARLTDSDAPMIAYLKNRIQDTVSQHMRKMSQLLNSNTIKDQAHAFRVAAAVGDPSDLLMLSHGLPTLEAEGKTSGTALNVALSRNKQANTKAICQLMCFRDKQLHQADPVEVYTIKL